jgi:predicted aspartyl protease
MKRAILCVCTSAGITITLLAFGGAATPTTGRRALAEPKVLAEFRLEEDSKLILLPVKLGENQYHFALDTGASNTVFDVSLKHRLGTAEKTTEVDACGKTFRAQVFGAPDAFLGPFDLRDCGQVVCIDLSFVSSTAGRSIHGIIGMDFLKKHLIQIDFDKGIISFLDPQRKKGFFASKKHHNDNWGEKIAIRFDSLYTPSIRGTVDGQFTAYFLIDTGYVGGYLPGGVGDLQSELFDKVQSGMQFESKGETRATAAGEVAVDFTKAKTVRTFAVGQLWYEIAIFYQSDKSRLGLPFLSRHLVTPG